MADAKKDSDIPLPDEHKVDDTDQGQAQQTESAVTTEKSVSEDKATAETHDENPGTSASGRTSRPRKNSTPSTPVSTPPSSRQITPPPAGNKHTPTPSPGGSSTAGKLTPTPSPAGSSKPTPSPAGSSASSKQGTPGKLPVRIGIQWKNNSRVEAKDFLGNWYPAKILEVDSDDITVLIHFEGWNSRYDEWIRMDSDRLRPATRHSERKEKKEKAIAKAEHKVNECVFAKWTDCRMYAARILNIKANGAYEVVFYDGFKKTVQPINIKPMPPDVQEQYGIAGWLPPPIKKNKVLKREDLMAPKMKEEMVNKQKKQGKELKKSAAAEGAPGAPAAAEMDLPELKESTEDGVTSLFEPVMPESTEQKVAEPVKETAVKKRSVSTDKEYSDKKKELKKDKITVSKTGVKTKGDESKRRKDRLKTTSPLKGKKLKIGGGFMFQTKRARIDALTAKINKAKEQRRQSAPAPPTTTTTTITTGVPIATVSDPMEAMPAQPEPTDEASIPAPIRSYLQELLEDPYIPSPKSAKPPDYPPDLFLPEISALLDSSPSLSPTTCLSTMDLYDDPYSGSFLGYSLGDSYFEGKKKQPLSITTPGGEQATLVPLIPKLKDGFPKKAFKVEEDHNMYKCPLKGCNKGFRKPSLVDYHVKYYHTSDGTPVRPPPPRKRKKTISVCSTDSEISVGGHKKKVRRERGSGASLSSIPDTPLSDLPAQSSFDESMTLALSEDGRTSTTEEMLGGEMLGGEILGGEMLGGDYGDEDTVSCDELYDKMEDEDFVNCICQIQEENGLMIQCDICLCWQHAVCMEITQETLPKKYVCYVCANPPGARDSARFISNQDWHREGALARFNFLPVIEDPNGGRQSPSILATHNLVGDVHNVSQALHGLRRKICALNSKKGREFHIWKKDWDNESENQDEDDKLEPEQGSGQSGQGQIHEGQGENSVNSVSGNSTSVNSGTGNSTSQSTEVKLEVKKENGALNETVTEIKSEPEVDVSDVIQDGGQVSNQSEQDLAKSAEMENKEIEIKEESDKTVSENDNTSQEQDKATETSSSLPEKPMEVEDVKQEESTAAKTPQNNTPTTAANNTEKSTSEISAKQDSKSQPKIESQPIPSTSKSEEELEPSAVCENNLLHHIIHTQDMIDTRLDDVEAQLDELENLESNGARPPDILRDVPALKKAIHNLMNDLTKVKRMARFH